MFLINLKYENENGWEFVEAKNLKEGDTLINWLIPEVGNKNGTMEFVSNIYVISVINLNEKENVYCVTEKDRNMVLFNDILTGNCTEVFEVTNGESIAVCNLASIALQKYIIKKEVIKDNILINELFYDFEELGRVTRSITKSLNIAIDVNEYSTKEGREHIKYTCEKYGIESKEITKLKLKV